MYICQSQFPNLSHLPSPLVSIHLSSTPVPLFVLCNLFTYIYMYTYVYIKKYYSTLKRKEVMVCWNKCEPWNKIMLNQKNTNTVWFMYTNNVWFHGDLPNPGMEPRSPALQADYFTNGATREAHLLPSIVQFYRDGKLGRHYQGIRNESYRELFSDTELML